jgi:hypothetical protein
MQSGNFIGEAWNRTASVANTLSAFKATGIFSLDQNAISDNFFSVCDAAETGEVTEPDGSESPINNSPEHSSLTNSGAPRHIGHYKTSSYAI